MSAIKVAILDVWSLALMFMGKLKPDIHNKSKLTILMFHRCLPMELREQYPYKGLAVTPEELDLLLSWVKSHFQIYDVSTALEKYSTLDAPEKPILALSFDDGQWDNYAYALPVLEKHQLKASFYIPTEAVVKRKLIWHDLVSIGASIVYSRLTSSQIEDYVALLPNEGKCHSHDGVKLVQSLKLSSPEMRASICEWLDQNISKDMWPKWSRLMTWEEIKTLKHMGHEIGSHTVNHNLLPQLTDNEVLYEIEESKLILEKNCGFKIRSLCYPNGSYDSRCIEAAKKAGFENAVTTEWGLSDTHKGVYELMRMDVDPFRHHNIFGKLSKAKTLMRFTNLLPRT